MAGGGPAINAPQFQTMNRTFITPIRAGDTNHISAGAAFGQAVDNIARMANLGTGLAKFFGDLDEKGRKEEAEKMKGWLELVQNTDDMESLRPRAEELFGDKADMYMELGAHQAKSEKALNAKYMQGVEDNMPALAPTEEATPQQPQAEVAVPVEEVPPVVEDQETEDGFAGAPVGDLVAGQPFVDDPMTGVPQPLPVATETTDVTPTMEGPSIPFGREQQAIPPGPGEIAPAADPMRPDVVGELAPNFGPIRVPTENNHPTLADITAGYDQPVLRETPDKELAIKGQRDIQKAFSYYLLARINKGQAVSKEEWALAFAGKKSFESGAQNIMASVYKVVPPSWEKYISAETQGIILAVTQLQTGNAEAGKAIGFETRKELIAAYNKLPPGVIEFYMPMTKFCLEKGIQYQQLIDLKDYRNASLEEQANARADLNAHRKETYKIEREKIANRFQISEAKAEEVATKARTQAANRIGKIQFESLSERSKGRKAMQELEKNFLVEREQAIASIHKLTKVPDQTPEGKLIGELLGEDIAYMKAIMQAGRGDMDNLFSKEILSNMNSEQIQAIAKASGETVEEVKEHHERMRKKYSLLLQGKGLRLNPDGSISQVQGDGTYKPYDPSIHPVAFQVRMPDGKLKQVDILQDPVMAHSILSGLNTKRAIFEDAHELLDTQDMVQTFLANNPDRLGGANIPHANFAVISDYIRKWVSPETLAYRPAPLSQKDYTEILSQVSGLDSLSIATSYETYKMRHERAIRMYGGGDFDTSVPSGAQEGGAVKREGTVKSKLSVLMRPEVIAGRKKAGAGPIDMKQFVNVLRHTVDFDKTDIEALYKKTYLPAYK